MPARRRRRVIGVVPRLGRTVRAVGRWTVRHPWLFLFVGAWLAGMWMLWGYVQRADTFRIAEVVLPADSSVRLRQPLIGDNLLTLDLRALADELKRQQPWLKDVRVVRRLPNVLEIEPIPRSPVAQVRIGRWYPVDEDGFILPEGRLEAAEELIRLVGLERGRATLSVGQESDDARLQLALRVLASLRESPPLISRRLTEVNVSDPQQIRFLIDGGATEVRCGSEAELDVHLERLRAALQAVARHPFDVGYIDVRFQEPVIHPRT